ncbi:hypothetical protein [Kosakonia radicincitans]|uniref:hypothetical protein n=1 Tax=Kosakonia radicincitans TaxID=283686 RepID=UPI000569A501|nr:hypothetical protein [Kosakonia radicincitans]
MEEIKLFHDFDSNITVLKQGEFRQEFTGEQWLELRKAAEQDVLFRIDNFERSPVPPGLLTQAYVFHSQESVSVHSLTVEPSRYDFSSLQWRTICMAVCSELVERLDRHIEYRRSQNTTNVYANKQTVKH